MLVARVFEPVGLDQRIEVQLPTHAFPPAGRVRPRNRKRPALRHAGQIFREEGVLCKADHYLQKVVVSGQAAEHRQQWSRLIVEVAIVVLDLVLDILPFEEAALLIELVLRPSLEYDRVDDAEPSGRDEHSIEEL